MKLMEILKKNNVYDFTLIVTLVVTILVGLEFMGDLSVKPGDADTARILDLVHLLKVDVAPENSSILLSFVYKRYIILFLGCGYLAFLILLTILFRRTFKEAGLYVGSLYFSLAVGSETLSYILPFDSCKILFTIFSWVFALCGCISFIKYFWENSFNKKSKVIEVVIFVLILGIAILLSLSIRDFYNIFFDKNLIFSGWGLHICFDYLRNGFIGLILTFNFASIFYNRNKIKKIESIYYCFLFFIQLLFNIYVYDKLNLYGNFEFMAHFIINILFVHVKLEDIKLSEDNQFFKTTNFNVIRVFIMFLTISYFVKKNTLTGYVTGLLAIIIFVEVVSFIILFFSEQEEVNFDKFLKRLKGIETLSNFCLFLEDEFTRIFRFIEFKMEIFDLDYDTRIYEEHPFITFSPIYQGKKYDIGIKIQNKDNLLGYMYVKDPCLLMYRKKLRNFKKLILNIAPILENVILKNLQINHYKNVEKKLTEKIEKLEKDIFYTRELLNIMEKTDAFDKKMEVARMIRKKINTEEGGEK
ncbi:hypothetical protein PM10SUCC1_05670 [Propionigenium maris DSM 9537]|uniref:Uncharacterized protein n=1 Tax=Propionigenium maris DSM 9537 TaxID=1123000 RepID=A0A9W6LLV7_9FUSO|nr:hypothetical protein [Propionigenium maris]GLI55052.1 hypothetical protein PM10SUCC1_05670 [Propionigenium maris DSM 9537]